MADIREDAQGRIVVHEPAAGTGGGVTSTAVRLATPEETAQFHRDQVQRATSALEGAMAAQESHADEVRAEAESGRAEEEKAATNATNAPPASIEP